MRIFLAGLLAGLSSAADGSGPGFLRIQMTRGNTMRESFHGWNLVENELRARTGHPSRSWTGARVNALRDGARHHFGISNTPPSASEAELQALLNGTGNPKVLVVWNYRAHWWRLGQWPNAAFEEQAQPNGLQRILLPGALNISGARSRQNKIIYEQNRDNVAMMRWAKRRWGYTVVLFDGQGSGCISSEAAHAKNKTCECGLEMLQIYSENVDAVFRHYYCPRLGQLLPPAVPAVVLPLGVHWKHSRTWNYGAPVPHSSARSHDYVFLGTMTDKSRLQMLQFVSRLALHPAVRGCGYLSDSKVEVQNRCNKSDAQYQAILLNSIFCPCPRGVKMESFRMTESLEAGCIPILDDSGTHFNHAWPGIHSHAVVTTEAWSKVAGTAEDLHTHIGNLLNDREALDARQHDMVIWYQRHKVYKRKSIAAALDRAVHPGRNLLRQQSSSKQASWANPDHDAGGEAAHPEAEQCPNGKAQQKDCETLANTDHDYCEHDGVLGQVFRRHCPVLCGSC